MATSSLTIGIDARAAAEVPGGRGRYVRELLRELSLAGRENRFRLYAREPWDFTHDDRFEWVLIDRPDPVWHALAARRANAECDVFLSTNSYLTVWMTRIPTAIVVYDLVPWEPTAHAQKRASRIERATIRPALRRAERLLCISEATERDLVQRFPAARGKTVSIPLAAATAEPAPIEEVRLRHRLERPFLLCTGTLEPRKNLPRLIEAYASLGTDRELLLVGPEGWELEAATAGVDTHGVRVLGFVSDADLAALYGECEVFAYPSLYEGFGLPLLEAMAMGAACVTSSISSLPEVGGDAVLYVDPHSVQDIARGLGELLGSPERRRELGERARARAAEFSWQRTAAQTLAELEALVTRR